VVGDIINTMLQVYKTPKKSCERKIRKSHVTLWLANVTNHNVAQVLPVRSNPGDYS